MTKETKPVVTINWKLAWWGIFGVVIAGVIFYFILKNKLI